MKATQAKATVNTVESRRCTICGQPHDAPYSRTQQGGWLCSRVCSNAWDIHVRAELLRYAPKDPPENERRGR